MPDNQLQSRLVHHGRVIDLYTDTVRFPDGSIGEMDIIRHPGASAVVPFLTDPRSEDPQILLIRQYRYAAGGYIWEIPAGRLDAGEEPDACAVRELREETGCTAERVSHLYTMFTTPGFTDEVIHVFMATGLVRGATAHENDEFMEIVPMSLRDALDRIGSGEIRDAKTALALMYAARWAASV
ncbi:MAG TPA: NUDIX hydrolase [Gemmatimonadaceae bacterium]